MSMGHSNLPFSLLSLLLLLCLSMIPSHASTSSTSCASFKCGNFNISYPFYLSDALTLPSQYCGYPGMGVFCDHERTPILLTRNGNYTITGIDYTYRTISLADTDVVNPPNPSFCLRVQHNLTFFNYSWLNYTTTDANLTFFFNCSTQPDGPDPSSPISCLKWKDKNSYVYPSNAPEVQVEYNNWASSCSDIVVAPVFVDKLSTVPPLDLVNQYKDVLRGGFELAWPDVGSGDCKSCERSRGKCVFIKNETSSNNWDFKCACADRGIITGDCGKRSKKGIIIGASVVSAALAAILLLCLVFVLDRQKKKRSHCLLWNRRRRIGKKNFFIKQSLSNNLWEKEERGSESLLFDFFRITKATNNFSAENKLGQGGFGTVYKGQLPDGQEIAVKRLAKNSGQGLMEFKNEILVIAKLQHTNLVKLLGYSIRGEEKILIYEYMQNKSLDFFLFDQTRGALLDWSKRFHIIEGVAQGLLYLHKHSRLKIIHRDLKASNILLDDSMKPKISDFGIARIFATNEDQGNFTNKVAGTFGYISPEYAAEGRFSVKSDVFSFGVLLLEIVSGKRNAGLHQYGDFPNLLGYVWEVWKEGRWLPLVDPLLGDQYSVSQVMKCIHVALLCVQEKAGDRPTMSTVTTMLSNEGTTALPDPKQPGFFNIGGRDEADESSEINETYSLNRVTVTDPMVR